MINSSRIFFLLLLSLFTSIAPGQISPGKLAAVHSHLEGLTNCTKCHSLGDKVTNEKCLACHTEIKNRVDKNLGYHSSAAIKGKSCVTCHNDHHGVNFQIIRFDKDKFDHNQTGYKLTGAHAQKKCADCHNTKFITEQSIKKKKSTYLGLNTNCVTCHTDYHQKTITKKCTDCHGDASFKPAVKFNHENAAFRLAGRHQTVPCTGCHKLTTKNGQKFQEFAGIPFKSCVSCHTDVHRNKFGQNCAQCHSEVSFHTIKGISNFDHSKTRFNLENKHRLVDCKSCHKNNLTDPLKFQRCNDCHKDYHEGQFILNGTVRDCKECHTTKGFQGSNYTVEQHNLGAFRLEGAHLATPCIACHKKNDKWNFRQIGTKCTDCHTNIHEQYLDKSWYPDGSCQSCHNTSQWNVVTFDHDKTRFPLNGAHAKQNCRTCHFPAGKDGKVRQQFSDLSGGCTSCHKDIHYSQFAVNGETNCLRCHKPDVWKINNFNHDNTAFKLDGRHRDVPCGKCHKNVTVDNNVIVLYKIKETKCENCH